MAIYPTNFPTPLTTTCTLLLGDGNGLAIEAECTGTPPTTANTFQLGCRMILTDAATGGEAIVVNTGTVAVPVWSGGSGSATLALTAADIIAMSAAPIVVVPAVAGKTIVVDSMQFDITRTSTAFTGGGVVAVQYSNTAAGLGTATTATIAATVVTGGAGRTVTTRIPVNQSDVASATVVGVGLYISNATASFAAGTGTAVVTVTYHLI